MNIYAWLGFCLLLCLSACSQTIGLRSQTPMVPLFSPLAEQTRQASLHSEYRRMDTLVATLTPVSYSDAEPGYARQSLAGAELTPNLWSTGAQFSSPYSGGAYALFFSYSPSQYLALLRMGAGLGNPAFSWQWAVHMGFLYNSSMQSFDAIQSGMLDMGYRTHSGDLEWIWGAEWHASRTLGKSPFSWHGSLQVDYLGPLGSYGWSALWQGGASLGIRWSGPLQVELRSQVRGSDLWSDLLRTESATTPKQARGLSTGLALLLSKSWSP